MTSKGAEKMKNDTIGVDISKDHFDAYRLADGTARRFANDKRGHKALIQWLAQTPANRVVFEPTGPYHRAFERALARGRRSRSAEGALPPSTNVSASSRSIVRSRPSKRTSSRSSKPTNIASPSSPAFQRSGSSERRRALACRAPDAGRRARLE